MKKLLFILLTFCFFPAGPAWSFGNASGTSPTATSAASSPQSSVSRPVPDNADHPHLTPPRQTSGGRMEEGGGVSFLAGPSIYKGDVGAALAMRYQLSNSEFGIPSSTLRTPNSALNSLRTPHWLLELGGVFPTNVSGYANDQAGLNVPGGPSSVRGSVGSYAEAHAAAIIRYALTGRVGVEAGVGVSMARVRNDFSRQFPDTTLTNSSVDSLWSPLGLVGFEVKLWKGLACGVDMMYVSYSNKPASGGQTLNLGFGGVGIRPALEWMF